VPRFSAVRVKQVVMRRLIFCNLKYPYLPQHFLCFFPLPHGQGSLRPTLFSAIFNFGGFNNISKSVMSSGLSGSNPIVCFQFFSSNIDATSFNLSSVCTLTTAGFFLVPNFAVFLPLNIFSIFSPLSIIRFIYHPRINIRNLLISLP